MKIAAITTSTPAASVALAEGRRVVASAESVNARGHAGFVVAALDFCVRSAGWSPGDIESVVVDVGPGLYTGIRVGVSVAQGIGASVGAQVASASSLDALALRAATGHRRIFAVVDVRRGEVAVAGYRPVPGGVIRDHPAELTTRERFLAMLSTLREQILLVGDTAALGRGALSGLQGMRVGRPRYPSAEAIAEAGLGILERGEAPHPDAVRPKYLRDADVNINWERLRSPFHWKDQR
ncbi:MAG: tRNA (adenosine(37)-N6)-threonylcarbamoyltransferase complex dimerization subunit type 1 TsaB [bacterium]|nr:tRNA (adenosine(37)-N6)-threonylcarbamoyltransferase complex dimerization subunit type 1 TsaB [Acidimicrobiia bacterium]MCY4651352.1 tRNA (adenosine(37)-N6)-threonylcarbamoyltransferase complex dimerization subunit type 1 TsaB [bacterium]